MTPGVWITIILSVVSLIGAFITQIIIQKFRHSLDSQTRAIEKGETFRHEGIQKDIRSVQTMVTHEVDKLKLVMNSTISEMKHQSERQHADLKQATTDIRGIMQANAASIARLETVVATEHVWIERIKTKMGLKP